MGHSKCSIEIVGGTDAATQHNYTFDEQGGCIGRLAPCSWILPGKKVSRKHLTVIWRDGEFYVTDFSQNGTYLNGKRLDREEPVKLGDGDDLTVADYALKVALRGRASQATQNQTVETPSTRPEDDSPFMEGLRNLREQLEDKQTPERRDDATRGSKSTYDSEPNTPELLQALLEGAGVAPAQLSAADSIAMARQLGIVLRITVERLHGLLNAREKVRQQFGLQVTEMQGSRNNPIRLPPQAALSQLLTNSNPTFLGAEEAISKTFADISTHELATLSGMEALLQAVVTHFNPDRLEGGVNGKGGILGLGTDYWRRYRDEYDTIAEMMREDEFFKRFGAEFEAAYLQASQNVKPGE